MDLCRDPIALILGIRFSILVARIGSLKHLKKPCYKKLPNYFLKFIKFDEISVQP